MPLVQATLERINRPDQKAPVGAKPAAAIAVQFNPASLRITRNNNVDRGGDTTRTQKRQNPSQEPATLTFELEFDTAEQGTTGEYVSVRRWTALVRQFVEPPLESPGDPPPVVRFAWGTLRFDGIVTQVTEELDYFAPDGTPLRAKVGLTVSEQDFRYEANQKGPGSRTSLAATDPGGAPAGAAPGSAGTNRPQQVVQAQAGESAQQLLARLGLDPAAWRAAMQGLDSPLSLAAGASVQLGAEISASQGVGVSAGFSGTLSATSVDGLSAALGIGTAGSADARADGFALAAGGGIAAAVGTVTAAQVAAATDRARSSFTLPAGAAPTGVTSADRRSVTYGQGVPLRSRADPGTIAEVEAGGGRSVADRARPTELPVTDTASAPWEHLPPAAPGRGDADAEQRRRDAGPSTLRWRPGGCGS